MIEEISIRDLGVIGEARLPLGPGFTALTGETGAGKTMVVAALGLLLGVWLRQREYSMYVLLATSLPAAFLSGAFWPSEALPAPLRALAQLLPSTAGMQAGVQLAQIGATLRDVAPQLAALGAIALGSAALLVWSAPPSARPPATPV